MTQIPNTAQPYPASLTVDYPDRALDRLSSFFRLLTAIPAVAILGLLSASRASGGALFLPVLLVLLFRHKYPRWWFDWHLSFTRFANRVVAYLLLLRDESPAVEEEQAVHVRIDYPDAAADLNRWLPFVKWLLALPHLIVLAVLGVACLLCSVFAWVAILFTGRYPRSLFDFIVGVLRWSLRVQAYATLLTTDRYPPFSLEED